MRLWKAAAAITAASIAGAAVGQTAELKILTAGAMKDVVVALAPDLESRSGAKLVVANDTVGALARRIEQGEACDVAVLAPAALAGLATKGKVVGGAPVGVARVGIGVVVKAGAPKPDIGTVEKFKQAIRAAQSVAYIDPASGGSSGVYMAQLFEKLGMAEEVKRKAKLKQGGHVADLIASGEAEFGIHQISEILPVTGVTLVGPLPGEIQNYTDYAVAICASSTDTGAARRLVEGLGTPEAKRVIEAKGMVPAS